MTEEQRERLEHRLREIKEQLAGKELPKPEDPGLPALQPAYWEVLMRRFKP